MRVSVTYIQNTLTPDVRFPHNFVCSCDTVSLRAADAGPVWLRAYVSERSAKDLENLIEIVAQKIKTPNRSNFIMCVCVFV